MSRIRGEKKAFLESHQRAVQILSIVSIRRYFDLHIPRLAPNIS